MFAGRNIRNHGGKFRTRIVAHGGANVAELIGLILNGLNNLGVLMPHVEIDQLRLKIEVTLAVRIPKPRAFAACNHRGLAPCLDQDCR